MLARRMVTLAAGAVALNSQFPVMVKTTEHDDEDEEMDVVESSTMIDVGMTNNTDRMNINHQDNIPSNLVDYINRPLFGKVKRKKVGNLEPVRQLGEKIADQSVIEMDEDGFAPVKKGNRRR